MHNVCAAGHIFGRRISGGVGRNGIAFSFFCGCITACGFQVDLKFSAGFIGRRAVKDLILLMNLHFSFDDLLFYCYLDFIVFQTVVSGFCPYRIYGTVNQISAGWRNFTNRPVIAANVLFRHKLASRVCGVLIDQVISSIHTVDRARKRGVALRSTGRAVALRDRGRPLFEDVRKGNSRGFIGLDRDGLRLRLHVLVGGELRHGQYSAVLQIRDGDRAVRAGLHRGVHAVPCDVEAHTGYHPVLRGLDDLQRTVHFDVDVERYVGGVSASKSAGGNILTNCVFVIESSSQIDKLTIHIVAKHNCSVFFWGACSFKGNGITLFCHRNPCCIGGRGILITGKCSCCICQRYGFAYLHSHCLTVDAGRCIKLVYFRENSLFEGVIGRLRGDVIHAAYGAGDRDAGCTDEAAAKAVDGFPDKELRVKLRHILCGYVNRIPVVVYGAAPFDIGNIFIAAPVVDESQSILLFFCQILLRIAVVIA